MSVVTIILLQLSYEFELIMKVEKLENVFMEGWRRYSCGIIGYAQASKTESKELKYSLRDDDTEGMHMLLIILHMYTNGAVSCTDCTSLKAARCLAHFLSTRSRKKAECTMNADIPYLIVEVPVS